MIDIVSVPQPYNIPVTKNLYVVALDYTFKVFIDGQTQTFVIPKGFVYDGMTDSRLFRPFTGSTPDGIHRAAVTTHDWFYQHKGVVKTIKGETVRVTRKQADEIFKQCLQAVNMRKMRVWLYYRAVRILGRFYWRD